MSELKPCPLCGGRAELQDDLGREDRIFYRAVCGDGGCQGHYCNNWSMTPEEAAGRWNARHERTCTKVPGKMHYGERRPKCSECGYGLGDDRWAYCPKCGAKVVSE